MEGWIDMDQIKWVRNEMPKTDDKQLAVMSLENVAKARAFHESFPQYAVTPLAGLSGMAKHLGISGVYVKDESYRFGLNAFKVLGGSFAMANYIAEELGRDVSEMTYDYLSSVRLLSLPQPTATTAAALHGLPTSSDRRQLS